VTTIPEPNTTVDPPAETPEPKPLTPTKRIELLEARMAEVEDRAAALEQVNAQRPPEPPFDPTLFVRRDELDDQAMRPHLDAIGKCELCSCTQFWGEHPSGDPDLCLNCNHHVGVHQKQAA
jgi:hypothetical protein